MTPAEATEQIRKACNAMTVEMMKVLPAARALADKAVQDEIIKAQFALTTNVEIIKKQLKKLEGQDTKLM
jgi:hypothetical protein